MNLIICTTPFQMLIAEQIIKLHSNKKFHLFVITHKDNDNDKYRFYYSRLSKYCEKSSYIRLLYGGKKIFTLTELLYLRVRSLFLPNYDSIFIANIESIWLQTFLSRFVNTSKIYTYDDGTANIVYGSQLYNNPQHNFIKKICFKLVGKKFDLEVFKKKSELHFTIYKHSKNIIEKTKFIELYPRKKTLAHTDYESKEVSLFLGQPLYHFDKVLYNMIPQYISRYNIDYYFPHPRENTKTVEGFGIKMIKTALIFEDYLIKEISSHNYKFKIYTIYSGSILNIAHLPNVEVYAIKSNYIPDEVKPLYDVFMNSGINVINYE